MTVITTAPRLCVWHLGDLEALSKFIALQQQQWKLAALWNCPHLTDKKTEFQGSEMTCSQARTWPQTLETQHHCHLPSLPGRQELWCEPHRVGTRVRRFRRRRTTEGPACDPPTPSDPIWQHMACVPSSGALFFCHGVLQPELALSPVTAGAHMSVLGSSTPSLARAQEAGMFPGPRSLCRPRLFPGL